MSDGDGVAEAAERERADDDRERERGCGSSGDMGAERGPADDEQHDGRAQCEDDGGEGSAGDQDDGGYRCRTASFQDAGFALGRDGDDEVDERGRDDAEGHDPWNVRDRRVDASASDGDGVIVPAEDRREDHEKQDRKREGEELGLAVAHLRAQVVPKLMHRHAAA